MPNWAFSHKQKEKETFFKALPVQGFFYGITIKQPSATALATIFCSGTLKGKTNVLKHAGCSVYYLVFVANLKRKNKRFFVS